MDSPDITQHTRTPRIRQKKLKKTPLARIYSLLISRLSTPLLTSLLLLPVIPASSTHTHNATFELVPFYKSLRCLVYASPHTLNAPRYRKDIQQWLSYWTLYSFIRFLEATRCNVSTGEERKKALLNAIDVLPKLLKERISKLFSTGQGSSSSTINKKLPRPMTLATQIAGSPTRWTIIKAILLFYAMDEELQGARRIMQKIIKPIFGFFTSLDEDEDDNTALYSNDTHDMPASRTYLSPEREGSSLKLSLEEKAVHNEAEAEGEDEVCMCCSIALVLCFH